MVKAENVYKTYSIGGRSINALNGLSVEIAWGEIFGFIGLSGAGKTSLVRCISALEPVTSGEILIDGVNLGKLKGRQLREARKRLGLVFQHFNLLMNSTVYENIAFPLEISGKPKNYIDKRVKELLELVGLTDKENAYPGRLSGGQKQRVGIARALAGEPALVLCDEATSALDPSTTKSILQLIKDINRNLGITFIIITHEMDVIKEICHKVAILEDGRIIESGAVTDVFINPKTKTGQNFFEMINHDFMSYIQRNPLTENGIVLKATFTGETAYDPIISTAIKKFGVDIAILSGNIQEIGNAVIGRLVIRMIGGEEQLGYALAYFEAQHVMLEVIPHVT